MERVRGAGKGISEGEQGIKVGKGAGMGAWMRNGQVLEEIELVTNRRAIRTDLQDMKRLNMRGYNIKRDLCNKELI